MTSSIQRQTSLTESSVRLYRPTGPTGPKLFGSGPPNHTSTPHIAQALDGFTMLIHSHGLGLHSLPFVPYNVAVGNKPWIGALADF
jgi:hypothetical protein